MNTKYKSSEAKTRENKQMFKISCKTRTKVNGKIISNKIVKGFVFATREAAEAFTVRLTLAEGNPRKSYHVK